MNGILLGMTLPALAWSPDDAKTGQTRTDTHVIDHGFRVRVTLPDFEWRLLDEEEASNLIPGSILGGIRATDDPSYGVVSVSSIPDVDFEPMARASFEALALEGKKELLFGKTTLNGREWIRGVVTGTFTDRKRRPIS